MNYSINKLNNIFATYGLPYSVGLGTLKKYKLWYVGSSGYEIGEYNTLTNIVELLVQQTYTFAQTIKNK